MLWKQAVLWRFAHSTRLRVSTDSVCRVGVVLFSQSFFKMTVNKKILVCTDSLRTTLPIPKYIWKLSCLLSTAVIGPLKVLKRLSFYQNRLPYPFQLNEYNFQRCFGEIYSPGCDITDESAFSVVFLCVFTQKLSIPFTTCRNLTTPVKAGLRFSWRTRQKLLAKLARWFV